MKKIAAFIAACLLALTAVCFAEAEHEHVFSGEYDRDTQEHWYACECGEIGEAEFHTLDDFGCCTICGSCVFAYDDGTCDVFNYDEYDMLTRYSYYGPDGELLDDYRNVYEYDAEGNILTQKTYYFDTLVEDMIYEMGVFGEAVIVKQYGYYDDGSRGFNEYDLAGNLVLSTYFDTDGTLLYEEITVYEYDEEYNILSYSISGAFSDGSAYYFEYNEYGDELRSVFYLPDGSIDYEITNEYTYDALGNKLSAKAYVDGVITWESEYEVYTDEFGTWSYEKMYTEYYEDGSRYVWEFDQEGNELSAVMYDAEGNVAAEPEEE